MYHHRPQARYAENSDGTKYGKMTGLSTQYAGLSTGRAKVESKLIRRQRDHADVPFGDLPQTMRRTVESRMVICSLFIVSIMLR
jgi:hypothetical protein